MKCPGCGTEVYVNELHRDEEQLRELADGGGTEHTPERCRTTSGVNRLIEAARGVADEARAFNFDANMATVRRGDWDTLRSALAEVAP